MEWFNWYLQKCSPVSFLFCFDSVDMVKAPNEYNLNCWLFSFNVGRIVHNSTAIKSTEAGCCRSMINIKRYQQQTDIQYRDSLLINLRRGKQGRKKEKKGFDEGIVERRRIRRRRRRKMRRRRGCKCSPPLHSCHLLLLLLFPLLFPSSSSILLQPLTSTKTT